MVRRTKSLTRNELCGPHTLWRVERKSPSNMLTRTALCDIQTKKINRARAALRNGFHNPVLMEEIDQINEILHIVVEFENKIIADNMDID